MHDQERCAFHPDTRAVAACSECGSPCCPDCLLVGGEKVRCHRCADGGAPAPALVPAPVAETPVEAERATCACPIGFACRSLVAVFAIVVLVFGAITGASLCSSHRCPFQGYTESDGVIQKLRAVAAATDTYIQAHSQMADAVEDPLTIDALVDEGLIARDAVDPQTAGYRFEVRRTEGGFEVTATPADGQGYAFSIDQTGHLQPVR